MHRGTEPTHIANLPSSGLSWPPVSGSPQVIVRLPDLRPPQAKAPTKIVAIDSPHVELPTQAAADSVDSVASQPAVKLEGPHWGRAQVESTEMRSKPARPRVDWLVALRKHPLAGQVARLAERRSELLAVLAAVLLLQLAMQIYWRSGPDADSDSHASATAPAEDFSTVTNDGSMSEQSPIIEPSGAAPQMVDSVHSPIATAPISEPSPTPARYPTPAAAPSSPDPDMTTDPRDVPPWESWPSQPKAAEPVSNQAASNTPAKIGDAPQEPTLAAPQSSLSGARPKSMARLKGTISRPSAEPTHEHARRSLY